MNYFTDRYWLRHFAFSRWQYHLYLRGGVAYGMADTTKNEGSSHSTIRCRQLVDAYDVCFLLIRRTATVQPNVSSSRPPATIGHE